jgi:hypothetical protein
MENALEEAIKKGAPMYNKGDIKGCAGLYMKTAESVLPGASGAEKQRLKDGLQEARSSSSSKDAAWALRHAFDDILGGLGEVRAYIAKQKSSNLNAADVFCALNHRFASNFLMSGGCFGVIISGDCFDGVRPAYVLAGAIGWTKTAIHFVHMFAMCNLLGGGHLGCQQVRCERALFIHLFLTPDTRHRHLFTFLPLALAESAIINVY